MYKIKSLFLDCVVHWLFYLFFSCKVSSNCWRKFSNGHNSSSSAWSRSKSSDASPFYSNLTPTVEPPQKGFKCYFSAPIAPFVTQLFAFERKFSIISNMGWICLSISLLIALNNHKSEHFKIIDTDTVRLVGFWNRREPIWPSGFAKSKNHGFLLINEKVGFLVGFFRWVFPV